MLVICSVYDCVKEQSVMISMHETDADAIRQFSITCSSPNMGFIKNDLALYRIGCFDPKELVIDAEDKTLLKHGSEVVVLWADTSGDTSSVESTDNVESEGESCGE